MSSTDTLGRLQKYYHWVGADSYICPYQCSLCCGSAEHHPVRLRLPPLHRRGISGAILFQQPHTTAIALRLYPAAQPDGVVASCLHKLVPVNSPHRRGMVCPYNSNGDSLFKLV